MNKIPVSVSMLTPLEVPIGKLVLLNILDDILRNIEQNRPLITSPDDMEELELMVAQRRKFRDWVQAQPGQNVAMAIYPLDTTDASEDGSMLSMFSASNELFS